MSVSQNLNIRISLSCTYFTIYAFFSQKTRTKYQPEDSSKLLQLLTEYRKGFDSCRRTETENVIFASVLLDVVSAWTFVFMKGRIKLYILWVKKYLLFYVYSYSVFPHFSHIVSVFLQRLTGIFRFRFTNMYIFHIYSFIPDLGKYN